MTETRSFQLTGELELWTYPDGRTVFHVEVPATEGPDFYAMHGEVDIPSLPALIRQLQAQLPVPEPVTHEATDPEWDEAAQENILACSCGWWEARGTQEEITREWEAHLDQEGVPANALAAQEAEEVRIKPGPELAAAIAAQEVPEAVITQVTPYNWNRVILATLATRTNDLADKGRAYEDLHAAQRELVAEIQAGTVAKPIQLTTAGLAAIAHRMTPVARLRLHRILVDMETREGSPGLTAQAVAALQDVAEAMGMDAQTRQSRSPWELGVMLVATVKHRERVHRATRLAEGLSVLPEVLADLEPGVRRALRDMLGNAAEWLSEPDPIIPATGTAKAASGVLGANVLGVFLAQSRREPCGCSGIPHWYDPAKCRARRTEHKG